MQRARRSRRTMAQVSSTLLPSTHHHPSSSSSPHTTHHLSLPSFYSGHDIAMGLLRFEIDSPTRERSGGSPHLSARNISGVHVAEPPKKRPRASPGAAASTPRPSPPGGASTLRRRPRCSKQCRRCGRQCVRGEPQRVVAQRHPGGCGLEGRARLWQGEGL